MKSISLFNVEVFDRIFLCTEYPKYTRSPSSVYGMAASDDSQSDNGEASNSTVELEVSKTPPRMTLRSHSRQRATDAESQLEKNKSPDTGKADKGADAQASDGAETEAVGDGNTQAKPKRRQRKQRKKKAKPTFQLPTQRSMRRDQVDEQCRMLNIKYKRWGRA